VDKSFAEGFLHELSKLASGKPRVPRALLEAADKDKFLSGVVHPRSAPGNRVPIKSEDGKQVVGFFTPRTDGGTWRVGAVYVHPEHRGKGLASAAVKGFMSGKKARAFVAHDNTSSRKMLERAGFAKTDEELRWGGGHWFRTPEEIEHRKIHKLSELVRGMLGKDPSA
jgi:ribosomal protein S18 acetylase RimI-like enzyme